ncbi:Arm DNA-binding domain-containing protein [Pseudogemmobacter bohemicus]|uniref:Arm DNA-binding domain-containing protein n=1 Tax=Pseudogemmobacter bohemicus TaxID=2250708 RepID=UPI0038CDA63F
MLSDAKIRGLKPRDKSYRVTDSARLYLQIEPGGGRHWRFGYSFGGKQKTLSLGSYPDDAGEGVL